ncbi:MAG: DUF4860 domain-containing protein [Clostridiales bacterium]|jgi:hypothetical protein|nr:DUF4860 domain-containing protein [Clostridiales bacterium]
MRGKSAILVAPFSAAMIMAAGAAALILSGAAARLRLSYRTDRINGGTDAINFVRARLKQNDASGSFALRKLPNNENALVIYKSNANGTTTAEWIYFYEGALYEYFAEESNTSPTLSAGHAIAPIKDWDIDFNKNGFFTNTVVYENNKDEKTIEQSIAVYSEVRVYE